MKNRIFKDSPFFDEAAQMPVDKDVFAFRMRQSYDFACSCSGTESSTMQIQKIESLPDLQRPPPRANVFRCDCLSDRSGGGIAEQRIGGITWVDEFNRA
jgi:hypothetical protein